MLNIYSDRGGQFPAMAGRVVSTSGGKVALVALAVRPQAADGRPCAEVLP